MAGGIDLKNEVLSTFSCSLCGACLDWCPYIKNLEDHIVLRFDCNVEQGRCYSVCPRTFTDWQEVKGDFLAEVPDSLEIGAFSHVYKVKSNLSITGQQDGGTVTILIKTALEDKMSQAALLTGSEDGITPRPFIAAAGSEVERAAGSRFLASPGLRKIIEAEQSGMEKMVVVGRPCQVQALRKMQHNQPPGKKGIDILSIGLFCMWSLSWKFKDYVEKEYPGLKVNRVSIPQSRVELVTNEGLKTLSTEKVREFIRPGCKYCLDMTSELADISVGALEALPGWNTVIVRSQSGQALLEKARDHGYITVEEYPESELVRLKAASFNKKSRALTILKKAFDDGMKPFIDLTQNPYKQIMSNAEGVVKS